ncbi:MAG: hypothetical protein NTW33_04920 [Methanoregula sp.]|nr:hypothetical protein [Methanoregula sp.]
MGKKREEHQKGKKAKKIGDCNLNGDEPTGIGINNTHSIDAIKTLLAKNRYVQTLLALTLIGAFLRFYNLGFNSLWLDEASTYTLSVSSIPQIWEATTAGEFNPPLFYWVEHIMLVFGNNVLLGRAYHAGFRE